MSVASTGETALLAALLAIFSSLHLHTAYIHIFMLYGGMLSFLDNYV